MEFPTLPVELMYKHILPELSWNDLLCFRRVCKHVKSIVDSFIRENGGIPNTVEIKIQKTGFGTFSDFLNLGFPASKFYFENFWYLLEYSGTDWFMCNDAIKFMKQYRRHVTHLTVEQMYTNPSAAQIDFYEALPNLCSLKIECLGKYDKVPGISKLLMKHLDYHQWFARKTVELPKTFKRLKVLSISQDYIPQNPWTEVSEERMLVYNSAILKKCKHLTDFKIGVLPYKGDSDDDLRRTCRYLRKTLQKLTTHIERRELASNLKFVDFGNYETNLNNRILKKISEQFLNVCEALWEANVRAKNVPVKILTAFNPEIHDADIISNVVLSMSGLHGVVLGMELGILEELTIQTMENVSFRDAERPYHTTWPALKSLSVTIMGTRVESFGKPSSISAVELFGVLFGQEVPRPSLEFLNLCFNSRMKDTFSKNLATFPCPRVQDIVSSCLNVTTLKISGWPDVDNLNFSKLWNGLKFLKSVALSCCKRLSDEGFIGENETKPAFLEMKYLKEVQLSGLQKMPLITDRVFWVVFRHLTVTDFVLQSDKPLKNITKQGILSLLSGNFATSVERFPFDEFTLEGVNDLEFAILKTKFRSSSRM